MNNIAEIEEQILKFWQKKKIFEQSIKSRKGKPFFIFYDGPPFATGQPHYGHILATTIKDTVLRYATMKGYQVPRRVGWDCHGLPVENLIEKELQIKSKKEIEELGIEKFNRLCRKSVFRCVKDFEDTLKRVGRWADYKNYYATLDNNYIESVWWVFSQIWKKGLVYKDYRVSPYCPRCGTPISNFEVSQGYKEVKDNSIYVKFKINSPCFENKAYFLAWTTTPWTLPGNVALAVDAKADYAIVKQGEEKLILAEKRLGVLDGKYKIVGKIKGKELTKFKYQPLFESLKKAKKNDRVFRLFKADFISLEEGSGIVHIASMYGQDDFNLAKKYDLPFFHTVDQAGCFTEDVKEWSGRPAKQTDPKIIDNLRKRQLVYKEEEIIHPYPFCWRCDYPLLYYALDAWYIAVSEIRKNLIENNKKIYWVPGHIKEGRFGKWLKGAKDWSFSRNRFWGAPIPIWHCPKCNAYKCIASLKELKVKIKDLHRPYIDRVKLKCSCGGKMQRVEEVFDCWFESGSMPYAQWHYPFENKKLVENNFPADFIAEGLDQTRGWFYTLHVISTALTLQDIGLGKNKPAFKNAVVNGLILDEQGRKLSKKLKNYPKINEVFEKYGADALRYFLLSSTPLGENYLFSSKGVEDVYRKIILTLWHSYIFFDTYKEKDFRPKKRFKAKDKLNQWIISRLNSANQEMVFWLEKFELNKASRSLATIIDDLSNWYIRRSRKKFQRPLNQQEKDEASQTLYYCLIKLSQMAACFIPFISEYIYQQIKEKNSFESIHLSSYPKAEKQKINSKLEKTMEQIKEIVVLALAQRAKHGIKVRQPLSCLKIKDSKRIPADKQLMNLIKEEVNVKQIELDSKIRNEIRLDTRITRQLKNEGIIREFIRHIQDLRKKAGLNPDNVISVRYWAESDKLNMVISDNQKTILEEAKVKNIISGRAASQVFQAEKEISLEGEKIWLAFKKEVDF